MSSKAVHILVCALVLAGCLFSIAGPAAARQTAAPAQRSPSPQISAPQEFELPALPPVGVNQNGETYGSILQRDENGQSLELTRARGTNGKIGYIRESDIPVASNPEEAIAMMASRGPDWHMSVPLYAADGQTVIGEFILNGG